MSHRELFPYNSAAIFYEYDVVSHVFTFLVFLYFTRARLSGYDSFNTCVSRLLAKCRGSLVANWLLCMGWPLFLEIISRNSPGCSVIFESIFCCALCWNGNQNGKSLTSREKLMMEYISSPQFISELHCI